MASFFKTMKIRHKRFFLVLVSFLIISFSLSTAHSATFELVISDDYSGAYSRDLFKLWIDEDKNGCDTRAEVLIEEAIVKPKIGPKCKLSGGKWVSAYDGKTITNVNQLDVDHLVPLAEAWRSGAWKWSPEQRQAFANDLKNPEVLVAVSSSSNRSKGDSDPSTWTPSSNTCDYLKNWILVKNKYSLTVDGKEVLALQREMTVCRISDVSFSGSFNMKKTLFAPIVTLVDEKPLGQLSIVEIGVPKIENVNGSSKSFLLLRQTTDVYPDKAFGCSLQGMTIRGDQRNISFVQLNYEIFYGKSGTGGVVVGINVTPNTYKCFIAAGAEYEIYLVEITDKGKLIAKSDSVKILIGDRVQSIPTPSPSPVISSVELTITPGAFCSPAGAIAKSSTGVTYTCKTSDTDSRNRWRQ